MKILLIDVNCKFTSTGKIVYDLYNNINSTNGNAVICYGRGPLVKEDYIHKFSYDIETYIHAFLTRITGLTGSFSPFSTKRLIKYIKNYKPDIVHIHELHGYFVDIYTVMNFLKKNQIKTVWTFHCEFMYTGKCGHSDECDKWKTECDKCPKKREYPSSLFFDFSRRMFNKKKACFSGFNNLEIISPSKWLASRIKKSFLKEKKVSVIHNGINAEEVFFRKKFDKLKKKHDLKDQKILLSIVPNMSSKNKGGHWILKLAELFETQNIKIIIIGVEDENKSYGNNIIALESIYDQLELSRYYSMADAFILCSFKETFSLTSAEALCCGTKVIGFNSGAPETIFKSPYADFVSYGDINALKEKIVQSFNDNLDVNEISDYGKSNFDKKVMFEKYLSSYKRLMK